ncbi:MAG TPA: hypothetical protein VFZ65_16005 [Planctomycetota bacterium]|nr:hypothetical protein [Planctomycetota bacterium]
MRTLPIVAALALLPTLSAQAPPENYESLPPRAEQAASMQPGEPAVARARPGGATAGLQQTRVFFDRPDAGGPLWALGASWKASFDARGFTAIPFFGSDAPRNFPVRFELAQATVGGEPLALADGEPVWNGNQVRTPRGALTEVIDASLDQLEQSFVFDALPNRGAIGVDVHVTTELAASAIDGGLRFANEIGHLDYTKANAVDAAGQRLPLAMTWNGSSVHMEIPASFVQKARLPIVLDPLLNSGPVYAGFYGTHTQHDPQIASFQSLGGRTLIIYLSDYSATDRDCWGELFDGGLNLVHAEFMIDFTANDWVKTAVAANNYAQNFLVVAEIHSGTTSWIGGRLVAANATVGGAIDIERNGVVGLGGNNSFPDVGSDPYFGVGRYTVVFTKTSVLPGIFMRQITTAGGLVTTNPVIIDLNAADSRPSISKSCGQSNGLPAWWMVTWQRTFPSPLNDCFGRFVAWNGTLPTNVFNVAITANQETAPSASSPFDANGVRYWPVVHENATASSQPRNIVCRVFGANTTQVNSFTVSASPGVDCFEPEIDSDGTRFVAAYTVTTASPWGYYTVEMATVAYLPTTNAFRVDERAPLAYSGTTRATIHADYSGGNAPSARYFASDMVDGANWFPVWDVGGWLSGQLFGTRNYHCGVTTINVTGLPVIGQTLNFDVQPGPLAAVHIGLPAFIPLNAIGCNCYQGVNPIATFLAPWSWVIPNDPAAVGLALTAQGFHLTGTRCLGFIDLSDAVDFTIR